MTVRLSHIALRAYSQALVALGELERELTNAGTPKEALALYEAFGGVYAQAERLERLALDRAEALIPRGSHVRS